MTGMLYFIQLLSHPRTVYDIMIASEVFDYLSRDPLRNIVPLKVISVHPAEARAHYFSDAAAAGVLLLLPTKAAAYESARYPETQFVVMIAADTEAITEQMLDAIPTGCGLVFKLSNPADRAVVAKRFRLEHSTSFLSYTCTAEATFRASEKVSISTGLDPTLVPLFGRNGYGPDELQHYFSADGAACFGLYDDEGQPLSGCFAYRNYGDVWEIAGVHTPAAARRNGYARQVVETALSTLLANGYIPRYQMDEHNLASKNLAESLGLKLFLVTEHLLSLPAE